MDFEDQMAYAIAASIKSDREEKRSHKIVLSQTYVKPRLAVSRKGHHPMPAIKGGDIWDLFPFEINDVCIMFNIAWNNIFNERYLCALHSRADLRQIGTFDQFHHVFHELIEEYETPTAICGYISMAKATLLVSLIKPGGITKKSELTKIVAELHDYNALMPRIKHAMQFVNESRRKYIDSHEKEFASAKKRVHYMREWVANYEISDYFQHVGLKNIEAVEGLVFARFNQYSERNHATHEEKERILKEEAIFGGATPHDKGDVTSYEATDSVFIMEIFAPERKLLRPEQFLAEEPHKQKVFVLDLNGIPNVASPLSFIPTHCSIYIMQSNALNQIIVSSMLTTQGHFCVAVPAKLGFTGKKQLILFNSTTSSYLGGAGGLIASMVFDLCFAPKKVRKSSAKSLFSTWTPTPKESDDATDSASAAAASVDATDDASAAAEADAAEADETE